MAWVLALALILGAMENGARAQIEPPENLDMEHFQRVMEDEMPTSAYDGDSSPSVQVWPADGTPVGQISGLGVDSNGYVVVFHRAGRVWDHTSFDPTTNKFNQVASGPIADPTVYVIDPTTGEVVKAGGERFFYMPHGLAVDGDDNLWLTDVAMHQVFKFSSAGGVKPDLVLGEKFVPGSDEKHFCKPTDVAVAATGEFFVGDGYCNSRVVKFAPSGAYLTEFGKEVKPGVYPPPPGAFQVPHSVTLVEDWNLLCVADRENERIQCFTAGLKPANGAGKVLPPGILLKTADHLGRVFAVRAKGHTLYGVTNMGLSGGENQVFKVDLRNGRAATLAPGLKSPHALAVADDDTVFVGEAGFGEGGNRILKIE